MRRLGRLGLVLAATLVLAAWWLHEHDRGARAAAIRALAGDAASTAEPPLEFAPIDEVDGKAHRVPIVLGPPATSLEAASTGALCGAVFLRHESYRPEVVDDVRAVIEDRSGVAPQQLDDEIMRLRAWAELLRVTDSPAKDVQIVLVRRARRDREGDGDMTPQEIARTRTDREGAFAFERLDPGSYEARLTPPSRTPRFRADRREVRAVAEVRAGEVSRVELVLPAASAAIAGRVLDEAGRPVAGATVTAARAADVLLDEEWYGDAGIQEELDVVTDREGRYSLRGLVPASLGDALRYASAAGARERSPSMLVVTVEAEGFVRMRVLAYPLTAELERAARSYGERLCAWRDAGTMPARLADDVGAWRPYAGGIPPAFEVDSQLLPDFVLAHGARVAGRVIDPIGAPLAGAAVRAVALDEVAPERAPLLVAFPLAPEWSTTGDEGAFQIDGLVPGRYALEVLAGNDTWSPARAALGLHAGEEVRGLELVVRAELERAPREVPR